MYRTQGRAKRDHIKVRILLQEESALQTCVYCPYNRLLVEESPVGGLCNLKDWRIGIRIPTRIFVVVGYGCSGKRKAGLHLICRHLTRAIYRAALTCGNNYHISREHLYRGKVSGGLHQTRHTLAHCKHSVRNRVKGINQKRGGISVNRSLRRTHNLAALHILNSNLSHKAVYSRV